MNILFVCKASVDIGFGHLIRSRTLAIALSNTYNDVNIDFNLVGNSTFSELLRNVPFPINIVQSENEIILQKDCNVVILDMLEAEKEFLQKVKKKSKILVSLSPVFNNFPFIDILFNRTKYLGKTEVPKFVYAGLEYSIVQENCKKISTASYERNLQLEYFPIAISMGGGDAANRTLQCLKELKKCKVPATFWVLLGEGYQHSYDELVAEIKRDTVHEVLLVKTNKNMWHILSNCLLLTILGGVTAYEAAYAGIPTLIYNDKPDREFLVKELVENNVAFDFSDWRKITKKIEELYSQKKELLMMHIMSKDIIVNKAHMMIYEKLKEHLTDIID